MALSFSPTDVAAIARLCLGDPNRSLSSKSDLRWGNHGSMSVDLNKATWFSNEEGVGGGILALIEKTKGQKGKDAIEWLRQNGFDIPDDRPQQHVNGSANSKNSAPFKVVATYKYVDESGGLIFEVQRKENGEIGSDGKKIKRFSQRRKPRPGDDQKKIFGDWFYGLDGVVRVPYRLPELIEAVANNYLIFIAEGEKCVDALCAAGFPATTNSAGGENWQPELNEYFRGADVLILPDCDEKGGKHADHVASNLAGIAKRVRVLDIPGLGAKEDVADWLAKGGTADALYDLVETQARDWTPPPPEEPAPYVSKFGGAFVHEIAGQKAARDWLIKGAMLARTFSLIIGAPGCGKSFLMLDYAMTAALCAVRPGMAREWFGRKIKPCGVVYVSAEGQDDFIFRIQAWLEDNKIEATDLPFYLIPTAIDLCTTADGAKALAEEIKAKSAECEAKFGVPFSVVIVDTVSRALGGGDENSPVAMGAFVKNCGAIKDQCGIAVAGVHHTPQGSDRARGHGALHGATDAEIIVTAAHEGAPNRWRIGRSKCGPTGAYHEFRLRQHILGYDEDGDKVTSCVVSWLGGEASHEEAEARDNAEAARTNRPQFDAYGRAILRDNLMAAMRALQTGIETVGTMPPVDVRAPHGRPAITHKQWLEEIMRFMPGDDKTDAKFKERCRKMRDAAALKLRERALVGMDGDFIWRTEKLVASIDGRNSEVSGHKKESQSQEPETYGANLEKTGFAAMLDQEVSF